MFDTPVNVGVAGINLSKPSHQIDNSELSEAINWWLNTYGELEVRPGLVKVLDNAPLSAPVRALFYYQNNSTLIIIIGAKVYESVIDGTSATYIGDLNGTSDYVNAVNYKDKIYIASGSGIQVYDGTSLSTLTASTYSVPAPSSVQCVSIKDNRLWATEYLGSDVYHSGAGDPTDWGRSGTAPEGEGLTLNGGSFSVRSGDGDHIVGITPYLNNLIVFKGVSTNTIHEIQGATAETYAPYQKSLGLSAITPNAYGVLDNEIFFCGNGGVYNFTLIDQVGNMKAIPLSLKINRYYNLFTPIYAHYSATLGYMFVIMNNGSILAYHLGTKGWYRLESYSFKPTCIIEAEDQIFVGGDDGNIRKLDFNALCDDGETFQHQLSTRTFLSSKSRKFWIDKVFFYIYYLDDGTVNFQANDYFNQKLLRNGINDNTANILKSFDGDIGFDEGEDPSLNDKYQGTYSSVTTYNHNDIVIDGGVYFVSLQDDNTGNATSDKSFWAEVDGSGDVYGFDEGYMSKIIPFKLKRTCSNLTIKVTGFNRVKLMHMVIRGNSMFKTERVEEE